MRTNANRSTPSPRPHRIIYRGIRLDATTDAALVARATREDRSISSTAARLIEAGLRRERDGDAPAR